MTPEMQQFIERTLFHLASVRKMTELLPADDVAQSKVDALPAWSSFAHSLPFVSRVPTAPGQ